MTGLEARLKEAAALGFTAAVVPQSSLAGVGARRWKYRAWARWTRQ